MEMENFKFRIKLDDLQFFAEGDPAGEGTEPETQTSTADGQAYSAADVEKLVAEKLSAAQTEWQQKLEEAKTEGEKLAKLSKQEREEHDVQQRLKDLEERESKIAERELRAETLKTLAEKQIPEDVIDVVLGKDAEQTHKNIESFKAVFDAAVQQAVEQRMAGKTPTTGVQISGNKTDDVRSQFKKALGGM